MTEQETATASVAAEVLVEQSPDALIFADREGVIRAWNAAAERIFGHTAADALGQTLDVIIPDQFREAHWTGFDRALAEGRTKYAGRSMPTRSMRAGGEQIYVELGFSIILDADGTAVGALATARDITDRFESDRRQRRRLRELEAELAECRGEPKEG